MTLTTKMLNAVTATGDVFSTDAGQYGSVSPHPNFVNGILYAQRTRDKSGMIQVGANSGLTGSVVLQGRMSADDSWYDIITITQADWNADTSGNYSSVKLVTIFPELRMKCSISAGSPNISAWLTE